MRGLPPGRPVTQPTDTTHLGTITWRQFATWAPLFVLVFVINCAFGIPPFVTYRNAAEETRKLFFGDDVVLPWER